MSESYSRFEVVSSSDVRIEIECDRPISTEELKAILAQGEVRPAQFSLFYYEGDDLIATAKSTALPSIGEVTPHGKVLGVIDASGQACDRMFVVDLEPMPPSPKKARKRAIEEKA